ncbi:MAG: TrkA family potassium uptake protein [Acutalibacteraceae bacterium]
MRLSNYMKIVIVGGGKLGYHLAQTMLERDYEVELIEKNKLKCMHLADVLDVEVICGDGTEIKVLADANTHKADCFIAVTGRDQDNLVASQLAKKRFQVKKVITRANNPRNLEALRKLGMENAVSSTEIITRMIEQEVESAEMRLLASLNKGKAAICEIVVPKDAKINGASLKDIELPHSSLIISILRDENLIIPQGDTQIYSGDEVVAVCDGHSQKRLMKILSEK